MIERNPKLEIEKIIVEHYDLVFRFCARRVGQELACDATQETFLTAMKRISEFEGRSQLRTWILGIALNHCRNLSRKNRVEVCVDEVWDLGQHSHEQTTVDSETLRCALEQLSLEHREVVLLHELEGLTYAEAGEILGIPEGTVKSRLHHAFQHLRKSLNPSEAAQA